MKGWGEYLTPARYENQQTLDNLLSDGDCAPEDLVLDQVYRRLKAETKLMRAVEGRLARRDGVYTVDARTLPRIDLFAANTAQVSAPGASNRYTVRAFVWLLHGTDATGEIAPGQPTVWGLVGRIHRALKAANHLSLSVDGQQTQLARLATPAPVDAMDPVRDFEDRAVFVREVAWDYSIDVDWNTGRIREVQAALA